MYNKAEIKEVRLYYHVLECIPANTNDPTHEIKPDKNELNGNVPTRQQ